MKKITTMQRIERAEKMAEERRSGVSLEVIGARHKMTRERVRQILKFYFPNEKFIRAKYSGKLCRVRRNCKSCSKEYEVVPSSKQNFCESSCGKKYRYENRKFRTPEEKKEYQRIRVRKYYHLHKNEPEFREKIRLFNLKYKEKRMQKNVSSK